MALATADKEAVAPVQEDLPPSVRLENWHQEGAHLCGQVYGHPYCRDGEEVFTSKLVWITETAAQTQNTLYALGKRWNS